MGILHLIWPGRRLWVVKKEWLKFQKVREFEKIRADEEKKKKTSQRQTQLTSLKSPPGPTARWAWNVTLQHHPLTVGPSHCRGKMEVLLTHVENSLDTGVSLLRETLIQKTVLWREVDLSLPVNRNPEANKGACLSWQNGDSEKTEYLEVTQHDISLFFFWHIKIMYVTIVISKKNSWRRRNLNF